MEHVVQGVDEWGVILHLTKHGQKKHSVSQRHVLYVLIYWYGLEPETRNKVAAGNRGGNAAKRATICSSADSM